MNIKKNGSNVTLEFYKKNSLNNNREFFLRSIGECLHGSMGFCMDTTFHKCYFHAHSISFLSSKTTQTTIQMIVSLAKQQTYLQTIGQLGFYCLCYDDILVIDNSIFICINFGSVQQINDSGIMTFQFPFEKNNVNEFYSPEIEKINSLPSKVSHKVFHYSLGALVIFCLFGKRIQYGEDIDVILIPIKYTKLYWFLLRLLCDDVEDRDCIFI